MRHLLHPFPLVIIAICCVIGAASLTLIMTSAQTDPQRHAAGWVGAYIVGALVAIVVGDVTRRVIVEHLKGEVVDQLREIKDEVHDLVALEGRRIKADLRQLPPVQNPTGPHPIRNIN